MTNFDILDGGACEGRGFCRLYLVGCVVRGGSGRCGCGAGHGVSAFESRVPVADEIGGRGGAISSVNTFGRKRERSGGRLILRGCNVSEFQKAIVMEREWKVSG